VAIEVTNGEGPRPGRADPLPAPVRALVRRPRLHLSDDLLFRTEESIRRWCAARGLEARPVLPIEVVWRLSRLWYGDRLSPEFHGRSVDQAEELFESLGLIEGFWYSDGLPRLRRPS